MQPDPKTFGLTITIRSAQVSKCVLETSAPIGVLLDTLYGELDLPLLFHTKVRSILFDNRTRHPRGDSR